MSTLKEKMGEKFDLKKNGLSFLIIVALSFIAMQIPFRHILGSDKSFTLFDILAPTFGALWGTTVGLVSILFVNLTNLVLQGDFGLVAFIRLVPVLFAIYHFSKRSKASGLIGLLAMVLFIAHPIGRQAWQYSLYWLIPIITTFVSRKNVFLSALGTTFTQHAVGSVAFLYAFGYTPAFWKGIIPVVAGERLVMALGIAICYIVAQALVRFVSRKVTVPGFRKAENFLVVE